MILRDKCSVFFLEIQLRGYAFDKKHFREQYFHGIEVYIVLMKTANEVLQKSLNQQIRKEKLK